MEGLVREQVIVLKDGRTIFKTSNGFKSFVESKKRRGNGGYKRVL